MSTLLKILLIVGLIIVTLKLLPGLLVPMFLGGLVMLLLAGLLLGGVGLAAGLGIAVLATLAAGVLTVLVVLSPIWIPVLLLVGIIALIGRAARA